MSQTLMKAASMSIHFRVRNHLPLRQQVVQAPNDEHLGREEMLDRTIEGSFPASDPPSSLPNPRLVSTPDREPRSGTADL